MRERHHEPPRKTLAEAQVVATWIRYMALNAHLASVSCKSHVPSVRRLYRQLTDVQDGALVVEISSIGTRPDVDAVGILISTEDWGDGTAFNIKTLDGRNIRWVSAQFIAAPTARY